jgi:RNA polymerase sigma-70 factor (ECF subfamily)
MSDSKALESTVDLVDLSRAGDEAARNRLIQRYLPLLTRWAHGRLPAHARDLSETQDLVQMALIRAFRQLPSFEVQGPGAFFGYLRQVMTNLLRDELRRVDRRPLMAEIDESLPESGQGPLGSAITVETLKAYESALTDISETDRELVMMRIELGMPFDEIAQITNSPSGNSVRMRVSRALAAVALRMGEHRSDLP